MADTPAKTPPPLSVIDWSVTEFVRNPGGAILDIHKTHAAVALAARNQEGWRLATLKEAQDYCELHNIDPKGLESYAAHVKDLQKEAEKTEGASTPAAAIEAEPEAEPKSKTESKAAPK